MANGEGAWHGIGDPFAVGRPTEVAHLACFTLGHGGDFFAVDIDHVDAVHLVVPQNLLAVGRPHGLVFVGVGVGAELYGLLLAVLVLDVEFVFASAVADVGDVFAVG